MLSLTDRFLMLLPALIMAALMVVSAMPLTLFSLSLVPNIVWLMTIAFARVAPPTMPALWVFLAGLMQDAMFGTPLGSQAIISVLLLLAVHARPSRVGVPLLRDVWAEAAMLLLGAHLLLAVIQFWVLHRAVPPLPLLSVVVVNVLWFPLFAFMAARYVDIMPKLGKK